MTQTNSGIASVLRENVSPGVPIDLVSRPTDFLTFLNSQGLVAPAGGSVPLKWAVQYATTDSSEIYVENQAAAAAGRRSLAQASLSPWYVRATAAVTGHVLDQVRNGGTYEDVLPAELQNATADLYSRMEATLLGSTQDRGIASVIDAGDTYAGLAPGSYSTWASYESAVGGVLTAAVMHDTYEALIAAPYNANPSVILVAPNQMTNYVSLFGNNSSISRMMVPTAGAVDIGLMKSMPTFNGLPLVSIRSLTSTEMYWLDLSSGISLVTVRDLRAEPLGKVNDNTEVVLTTAVALKVLNRRRHGKLTGVTA